MLVDAGARHPEDQTVQARVAGALWGLSVHDEIAELIGVLGLLGVGVGVGGANPNPNPYLH